MKAYRLDFRPATKGRTAAQQYRYADKAHRFLLDLKIRHNDALLNNVLVGRSGVSCYTMSDFPRTRYFAKVLIRRIMLHRFRLAGGALLHKVLIRRITLLNNVLSKRRRYRVTQFQTFDEDDSSLLRVVTGYRTMPWTLDDYVRLHQQSARSVNRNHRNQPLSFVAYSREN